MKPILAVWLAVLALLCLWVCLETGKEPERTDKVVVDDAAAWEEAPSVAQADDPGVSLKMTLAVAALPLR